MRIEPQVEVANDRYGFDLIYNREVKVGYVVVDSYLTRPRGSGDESTYVRNRQWEIEILPQFQKLLQHEEGALKEFILDLEKRFSAHLETKPKYLNTSEFLQAK